MPKKTKKVEDTKKLTKEQIDDYINGIFDGSITTDSLSEEVYFSIANTLKEALYEGYGQNFAEALKEGGKDAELLAELRENVYMFGAAKNYQMTKDISSLLIDDDGNVRTNKEFNEIAKETYSNWNDNWGETEYSTAYGQGQAAVKWNMIEEEKDVLPNLRYSAIGDACDICEPLDGLTAPVDDPIWNECAPLNHFNCRCILQQVDEEANLSSKGEMKEAKDQFDDNVSDTFKSNPGKDGMVFNENHPYFQVAKEDKELAKDNFNMPIPKKD